MPHAELLIFGKGSRKTLNKLDSIISKSSRKSIHLKGFAERKQLEEIYSSATCAVFPSFAESFGMAPLEAMAQGCPTIFTTRTSGPELIENGKEGLLVDPGNISEVADAIIYLIKERDKALDFGRNGSSKVRTHFDISTIAQQHLQLYEGLIKDRTVK